MKILRNLTIILIAFVAFAHGVSAADTPQRNLSFAWGAEIGGNVDMSQHSMSSIAINAKFGLQWKWIRFLGVGAQSNFMVTNSNNSYPIFVNFRTDFHNSRQLLFMDLRGGVALNYFGRASHDVGAYAAAGIGFTLASGKAFSSHIIVGYSYLGQEMCYNGATLRKCPGISLASLRLGITFHSGAQNQTAVSTDVPVVTQTSDNDYTNYAFINAAANRIVAPANFDSDKWKRLARDITNARKNGKKIDIVHIGDSHIQAEMGTSVLRRILQDNYGNAGRGLITAFRLAGTNQPVDYDITADLPVDSQVRLLKRPWEITPGFTGVASLSNRSNRITFKNRDAAHRFDRARLFTSGGRRDLAFAHPMDSAAFVILPGEKVYGVYTTNSHSPGVVYSTIGNNGACYSDYLLLEGFADSVAMLQPRLIVLSMGTNEGYSSMTDDEIAGTTRQLIQNLRKSNPNAAFLMWTPMECQAKDDDGNFAIKSRVRDARDIMLAVAGEECIPVWDFYDVAGGYGAAQKWVDAGLMNPKDHVHLLGKGYRLQGQLAAEALMAYLASLL